MKTEHEDQAGQLERLLGRIPKDPPPRRKHGAGVALGFGLLALMLGVELLTAGGGQLASGGSDSILTGALILALLAATVVVALILTRREDEEDTP